MSPTTHIDQFSKELLASQDFFARSTRVLEEADSNFRPQDGMMTAAQQVAHVAMTIDWFIQGASRPEGFDLDFEKAAKEMDKVNSLSAARAMLDASYKRAVEFVSSQTPEQMSAPLPPGPVMGGEPTGDIIWGIVEHTAHHRGALTMYSRLLGKVPPMPYGG
jgi:uncharacterized damage-inducible protein DinB